MDASFAGAFEITSPTWSRDGKRIAFGADPGGYQSDIYTVTEDGTDPVQITDFTTFHAHNTDPSWSPDGEWLTFTVDNRTAGTTDIYVVPSDGAMSPSVNLTADNIGDSNPDWSEISE